MTTDRTYPTTGRYTVTARQIIALRHVLQPWSPDDFTLSLIDDMSAMGEPFCVRCADWHATGAECSSTGQL